MKKLLWFIFFLCSLSAQAADPWAVAAKTVIRDEVFNKLPVKVALLKRKVTESPTSLRIHENGTCTLMLQHRVNKDTQAMAELAPIAVRPVFLQAIVAHELAHCWRQQDAPERMSEVFQLLERASREPALAGLALQARNQEEIFADVAALAWVERRHPSAYAEVLETFVRLRSDARFTAEVHNTRPALERILRHGMLYGDTPFHAADTTLAVLRPGRVWSTRQR